MSIAEQAGQLQALSEQVPVNAAQELKGQLEGIQQQVAGILGDTATAQELHGQIGAVSNEINQLAAGLEQLRLMIVEKAPYHQQG
ncbi:hypothetical protein [Saccharopolyspora pogona]|uniref:hypothetical protein n=1 Tax=Saccharopolyspora pogona TaxID=333966 RepID=UPI001686C302|nr:hypothetical protein [Saccharopolyspora pogona]